MTSATALRCSACNATLRASDRFCEECGARQVSDEPMRDRTELDLVVAAGVSDRGRVHHRNEDAFCLEVGRERQAAAVVCDGISSASAGDAAARTAARAAATVLAGAVAERSPDGRGVTRRAIAAAQDAVARVPWTTRTERAAPSCTLVCALWHDDEVIVGALGDSRAYWHEPGATLQLTVDDSWAEEQVAEGQSARAQAMCDPRSHAITHWVGADAPVRPPRISVLRPERSGRLLLCTDGLWNYVQTASELGELIDALPAGASPAGVARALTDVALERGGRDNITVAVIDIA